MGIDQCPVGRAGHGIDGEVATAQIVFQGDVRVGLDLETPMSLAMLALGSGQRVFLAGPRMQEHGEITPHLAITLSAHLRCSGAHHHMVPFVHRQAQQFVPDCAADQKGVHHLLRSGRPAPTCQALWPLEGACQLNLHAPWCKPKKRFQRIRFHGYCPQDGDVQDFQFCAAGRVEGRTVIGSRDQTQRYARCGPGGNRTHTRCHPARWPGRSADSALRLGDGSACLQQNH